MRWPARRYTRLAVPSHAAHRVMLEGGPIMLGGFYHGDHALYVRMHLEEVRTQAEGDRRARQARGSRSLRRRLGHMIITAGTALLGPPTENERYAPRAPRRPDADAHPVLPVAAGWSLL